MSTMGSQITQLEKDVVVLNATLVENQAELDETKTLLADSERAVLAANESIATASEAHANELAEAKQVHTDEQVLWESAQTETRAKYDEAVKARDDIQAELQISQSKVIEQAAIMANPALGHAAADGELDAATVGGGAGDGEPEPTILDEYEELLAGDDKQAQTKFWRANKKAINECLKERANTQE